MTNDISRPSERAKLVAGIGKERGVFYQSFWTGSAGTLLFTPQLYEYVDAVRDALVECNSVTLYSIKSDPDMSWFLVGTKLDEPKKYFEVGGFESLFAIRMLMEEGQKITTLKHLLRSANGRELSSVLFATLFIGSALIATLTDVGLPPKVANDWVVYGTLVIGLVGFAGLIVQSKNIVAKLREMASRIHTLPPHRT